MRDGIWLSGNGADIFGDIYTGRPEKGLDLYNLTQFNALMQRFIQE